MVYTRFILYFSFSFHFPHKSFS